MNFRKPCRAECHKAFAPAPRFVPLNRRGRLSPDRTARICFFIVFLALPVSAQNVAPKFRVAGKVVSAVTGRPVAGAELLFGRADDFEATQQKLLTADDGAFAFTVAEPGKYTLNGQAYGFRSQGFEQHGVYVSAIVVGKNLNTENIVFRLRPDARLMGVVEDEDHEAIGSATVYLFHTDVSLGLKLTSLVQQVTTDDRGRYRFAHLEPGDYYVVVSASPWFSGLLQQTDAAQSAALSQKPEFDVTYSTTFYPGVTDVASASQISLNDGADFTADFTLSPVPALRVVVDDANPDGEQPPNVALHQKIFNATITQPWLRHVVSNDSVEIRGVPPGAYVLDIPSLGNKTSNRSMRLALSEDAEFDAESASAVAPIRGVVRTQAGVLPKGQVNVFLWNSRAGELLDSSMNDKGEVNFDNDFLVPGTYSVYAMSGPNSIVSSLKATGARVAGQTVEITGGKAVQLEIEMASTLSKITGTVQRDGKPVLGAMILLVPEEAEINLPKFRRDQSDSDGTFTLVDVLPGHYRILAIENGWNQEWANASLLTQWLEHAQKIDVQGNQSYHTVLELE